MNFRVYYISNVDNPFDIQAKDLNIIGKRNDGSEFYLRDSTGSKDLNFLFKDGGVKKVFTQDNSNINDFISFLPDEVILTAEYIMNPNNSTGSATDEDSVKFETDFTTRSFMALKKSAITDTTEVVIDEKNRADIRNGIAANLNFNVENSTPLTTWLKVTLTDQNYKPLFVITKNAENPDSLYFLGADVNQNGEVINSNLTSTSINLDSIEIAKLADAYYAISNISVRTRDAYENPPPTVAIRPGDLIKLKVYGAIKYVIKPDNK